MLADFYIPRLSNDVKTAVQKNNLVGQIWYRSLEPVKKTASKLRRIIIDPCIDILRTYRFFIDAVFLEVTKLLYTI